MLQEYKYYTEWNITFWGYYVYGEYYVLGLSFPNPWFTGVIYVFRNREAAEILIDFLFLLNLGFSSRHPLAAVCSI